MTEQNTFSISELQQKANDGDAQAQFDLALCYAKGTDIEKNAELALDWHKKAAEQGHAKAQFALGLYHLLGNDQVQQTEKFLNKWLRDKFVVKNVDPALDLAVSLVFETKLCGTNDDMAFAWLKKAAEQDSYEANYWLGQCYRNGIGTEQSDELAFDSFKKAAELGLAESQYRLACCYFEGEGVELNDELGMKWCEKSANKGIPEAQYLLACRYLDGNGIAQNLELGLEWLSKAAQETHEMPEASMRLADCHTKGIGVKQSDELAFQWLQKIIDFSNFSTSMEITGEALYQHAKMYLEGRGVETNYKEGMECLIEAIKCNYVAANQWLENTYLNFVFPYFSGREDIEQCYTFAYEWLSKGFEENPEDFEINFGLGVLYAFGKGVEKNQERAVEYFYKFETGGDIDNPNTDHPDILDYFSNLFCSIYKHESSSPMYCWYPDELAPAFIEKKYMHRRTGKPIMVLPVLRINFYSWVGELQLLREFLNGIDDSESIFEHSCAKNAFKIMTSTVTKQTEELEKKDQELEDKNKKLEESQKELEDMMSMFAHKFRSPLDAIIYNTTHENQVKLYTEAAQTMRGLLNIFSIISTDAEILKDKIKQDRLGSGRLATIFSKTLDMILLHLLSVSGAEKIQQHYMTYAKAHGQCDEQVSYKTWCEEYFELEQALQTDWEQSFAQLLNLSATLEQRLAWVEQHFFKLELIGFERTDIQFKEYGVTESFLTISLNEILVNAFKYYSSATKQPVVLEWAKRDGFQVLICRNPSIRSERTTIKGSHKGHTFLSALARKTGSAFTKPTPQDDFVVEFGIPDELLISK